MSGGRGGPAQQPAGEQGCGNDGEPAHNLPQEMADQTVQAVARRPSPAGNGLVQRHANSPPGLLGWELTPRGITSPSGGLGRSAWQRVTLLTHYELATYSRRIVCAQKTGGVAGRLRLCPLVVGPGRSGASAVSRAVEEDGSGGGRCVVVEDVVVVVVMRSRRGAAMNTLVLVSLGCFVFVIYFAV